MIRKVPTPDLEPSAIMGRMADPALHAGLEVAAVWFEEQLEHHPDRARLLDDLGIGLGELRAFRLGYAPVHPPVCTAAGISPSIAEAVGLLEATSPGYSERFTDRLMLPIMDAAGHVLAFRGRAVERGSGPSRPKYVSMGNTPVYDSGTAFFGLWQAQHGIRSHGRAVIVDAHVEVLRLHAMGFNNVISPAGSSFTQQHARSLKRYTEAVALLWEDDPAGRREALVAERECRREGLTVIRQVLTDCLACEFVRSAPEATVAGVFGVARPD
jgi:DNA primase